MREARVRRVDAIKLLLVGAFFFVLTCVTAGYAAVSAERTRSYTLAWLLLVNAAAWLLGALARRDTLMSIQAGIVRPEVVNQLLVFLIDVMCWFPGHVVVWVPVGVVPLPRDQVKSVVRLAVCRVDLLRLV